LRRTVTSRTPPAVEIPSDDEGPDMRALERVGPGAKLFYVMPACHNPTGRTVSRGRRDELVAWSRRAEVPLVEDDYAADLWLEQPPASPALRALDGQVIYVGSYSKRLAPGLRVGFLVCPEGLRKPLLNLKHMLDLGTSPLTQLVLAEFLDRGYLRRHLETVLPEYRRRRDVLETELARVLPPEITWRHPDRGLSLWLDLPRGVDAVEAFAAGQRKGVLVQPGTLNSVSGAASGLRLTFCAESPERIAEGARRLGRALEPLVARRERGGDHASSSVDGV
jgi:DNA-binding transcriptional MocR family regulator